MNDSKAGHTAGPWVVLPAEDGSPYLRIRGTRLGGRYKIANVVRPVYQGSLDVEAEETIANARLIAAAPDLLAALRLIRQRDYLPGSVYKLCDDAIKSATGEPQP